MEENKATKIVYSFIKSNLINIIVVLTSLVYILLGLFNIEITQERADIIWIRGGLGIIVGILIKAGIGENGFNKGYNSALWASNYEKYNSACNIANPYIERVDNFYQCEEIEKKKQYRRTMLMNARMKYEWFFDNDGYYIENNERYNKLDKHQKQILKKCIEVKIYNLNLFSEYGNEIEADTKREKTDKEQRTRMIGKNSFTQIVSAIAGVWLVIPSINANAWYNVIISAIQVMIWLFCGVLQLYTNYNYVVVEKVNKLKRKIELIAKFVRGCENGLYQVSPYEDKGDIDDGTKK